MNTTAQLAAKPTAPVAATQPAGTLASIKDAIKKDLSQFGFDFWNPAPANFSVKSFDQQIDPNVVTTRATNETEVRTMGGGSTLARVVLVYFQGQVYRIYLPIKSVVNKVMGTKPAAPNPVQAGPVLTKAAAH